ncbi:MAG: autoinducer-2 kinase [Chloroflexi bacterium]|nr:autoinducer-2 kinase [Chloroflexota bacterium]
MTTRAVMTIDAGSGSCRALLFDTTGGLLGVAQQEWAYQPVADWPGALDFDTVDSWHKIGTCTREVMASAGIDPRDILAIAATSMREGFVLYDGDGQEIWACPNVDARAGAEAEALIAEGVAQRQYRRGGDWTSIVAPPRLRWIQRHQPEVWRRARHLTMLGDWIVHRLSGEWATDPSLGSSSNLFALASRTWSPESAAELDLPDLLPPVFESGTVVGQVSQAGAEATGLAMGTPVVAAGADTQLALLGAGLTRAGQFATVGGTFWQTAGLLDEPLIDPRVRVRTLCHVLPGMWMIEGIGFMHGLSTRWLRDGFLPPNSDYAVLDRLAATVPPGSNGVQYLCSNAMDARRWRHGPPTIVGFDILRPQETGLGALFRAVMEEAAYVSRAHYAILAEVCGTRPDRVCFVGGPSRGPLWPQILADVLDLEVDVPAVAETTCLGAAMCALVGAGVFASLPDAAVQTVRVERTIVPDPVAAATYEAAFARRQALYEHMLVAAERGLAPYLWQGAGAARSA